VRWGEWRSRSATACVAAVVDRMMTMAPSSEPRSGERATVGVQHITAVNPIADATFQALRDLRRDFGCAGIPSKDCRTQEDDARLVSFCVLQELVHILDQFRRAVEQGEQCRLVVREHGRQLGKAIIEISIQDGCQ
jgi:hypothetical protein